MKKILIPVFIIVAIGLIYELYQDNPNLYIKTGGIAILMYLLYRLNAKVPSKYNEEAVKEDEQN